jgi:hypothetical protein
MLVTSFHSSPDCGAAFQTPLLLPSPRMHHQRRSSGHRQKHLQQTMELLCYQADPIGNGSYGSAALVRRALAVSCYCCCCHDLMRLLLGAWRHVEKLVHCGWCCCWMSWLHLGLLSCAVTECFLRELLQSVQAGPLLFRKAFLLIQHE